MSEKLPLVSNTDAAVSANLPLVSLTKEDIERMKMDGVSGSAIVANLVERLEKEKNLPHAQRHNNHQKHNRDDPS